MSHLTLSQRTTHGKGDQSSDLSRLLFPAFTYGLCGPSWSFSHRTISTVMILNAHAQPLLSNSALQAAHNCLLDITWLSQGISNLAQSCCSPGHSCPTKWHHLLSGTQVKNPGAALVPSWHLNHQEALGIPWWSSVRTWFSYCYRSGFDL